MLTVVHGSRRSSPARVVDLGDRSSPDPDPRTPRSRFPSRARALIAIRRVDRTRPRPDPGPQGPGGGAEHALRFQASKGVGRERSPPGG
jgi:hypothetical protein